MNKKYKSGSSSVLVIMIVMTLAVLGVFSVISSRSEKSLAQVNYKAMQDYYEVYGESNRVLAFLANRIFEDQGYDTETMMKEIQQSFSYASEVQFEKEKDQLMISMELINKGQRGLPYELKVLFRGYQGEYEILSSRVLSMEIKIDESEKFEIVE